jgi:uncharacterized membrane protein
MRLALFLCAALSAACFAATAYVVPRVGDDIPIHWGIDGQPDGYGSPLVGLLILSATVFLLPLFIAAVQRLDPRREHLERSMPSIARLLVAISAFMALLHALVIQSAFTHEMPSMRGLAGGMGLLMIVLGNELPKLRSNHVTGIRTSSTLSSERVWHRTHRVGGLVVAAGGVVIVMGALLLPSTPAIIFAHVVMLASLIAPAVLSHTYAKQEPGQAPES